METELAGVPGVKNVAAALVPLIAGNNWGNDVKIAGTKVRTSTTTRACIEIGPGFFGKMGIPLIAGREFTESDSLAGPKVAVVNETVCEDVPRMAGIRSASIYIGRRYKTRDIKIVGVVKDSHYSGVKQEPPPLYFTPWRQDKRSQLAPLLRAHGAAGRSR